MAITTPITGNTSVMVGQTTTLSNATVGGNWSSSNTAIATVNGSGVVTGVAQGACVIVYTVGSDSISVSLGVTTRTLSNGFDIDAVYNGLKNRVLWLSQGVTSQSRRYYEDFHTLCDTALLDDLRPDNGSTTSAYLDNLQRSVVLNAVNAVYNAPQVIDPTRLCFYRGDWQLYPQPVANTGQFVGLRILVSRGDFAIKMNSVELFFDNDCTFNMYLYNDMTLPPIYTIEVTASAQQQVIVPLDNDAILNWLSNTINKGGTFYFGYYQDDIEAQGAKAMYYSVAMQSYKTARIWAYSAQVQTDVQGNRNFKRNPIGSNNLTYGLNLEITTYIDATNNVIRNGHLLDNLIGLQMAAKVVEALIFSYRANGTQRNIMGNDALQHLYEELNLAKPSEEIPYSVGLRKQINQEVVKVKQALQKQITKAVGIV
jgi:hypothetical protein